ncbi:MAG: hypothetical protein FJ395_07460 [Verrucomicrobia bacterium]|nr:hypothetical protein [Verrucomicrobiota bacterium]
MFSSEDSQVYGDSPPEAVKGLGKPTHISSGPSTTIPALDELDDALEELPVELEELLVELDE